MKTAKVLIVEDNPINVIVLKKFIEDICFLDTVTNGLKALEMLEKNDYLMVFLDINLGSEQMTGVEVLQKIRENQKFKDLPIVAVTAYVNDDSVQNFKGNGFNDFIAKPIEKAQILSVLHKYLPAN